MPHRWPGGLLPLLLAVVAASYLLFPWLPFQDLPAHAGLLALRERLDNSPLLSAHFEAGSRIGPYGLFLGLGHLLHGAFGPDQAIRLTAALANLALPGALIWARSRLFSDSLPWPGAGQLALVLALGFPTALGLHSFLFGLAVLLLAVAPWLRTFAANIRERRRAEASLAVHGLAAALTHGFAFVSLVLVAGISLLCAPRGYRRPGSLRALLPGAALLFWFWWRDRGFYPAAGEPAALLAYAGWSDKLALPFLPTLLSRLGSDVVVAAVLWLVLGASVAATIRETPLVVPPLGTPGTCGRTCGLRRLLLARTAAVLAALSLLAPTRVAWFGSVDLRLCSTALLLATLGVVPALHRPRLRRWLERVPRWLALAMTFTLVVALAGFQSEARAPAALLAEVPAGTRLLHLPVDPKSRVWAARPFLHFDKLLLLDRDVVVSDLWLHQGSALRARDRSFTPLAGPLRLTAAGDVDWRRYQLTDWDQVLVRVDRSRPPLAAPASLELVAAADAHRLYRIRKAVRARPPRDGESRTPLR